MKKLSSKGFTLVEMLVSVALFAIVMLMVSSAYLVIIASNRDAQAVAAASDDLAFALDTMARSIRTGTHYSCGTGDCFPSPSSSFSFVDANACTVTYTLLASQVVESVSGSGCHSLSNAPLTDSSVTITGLSFYAQGDAPVSAGDYREPQVLLTISGTVATGPGMTLPFTIETGATQRQLDL